MIIRLDVQIVEDCNENQDLQNRLVVYSVILGCFGVINIIGVVLLLSWKKIGFTILAVSITIGSILSSLVMSTIPFGVVGIVVLWFILTIKKNGISYWEAMD